MVERGQVGLRCGRRCVGLWTTLWALTVRIVTDSSVRGSRPRDATSVAGGWHLSCHVIAISGGNIAILSGVLLLALQLTGVSARPAALVTIGCLLAYAQVVGSEASVARATFAAATFLAARAVDHRSAPLNTVALSATCLLGVSPLLALDAGFLLTFGATLGILLGVPPILSRVRPMLEPAGRWGQWLLVPLLGLFAATVCAELALVPVAAAAFSRVTIAGLALNFVAIPLMAVAQLAGMCAVGGGLVMSELAAPFGYIAHLAAAGIVESARLVDYLPWLAQRVPSPDLVVVGSYYLGLALCVFGARARFIRVGGMGLAVGAGAAIVLGPIDISARSQPDGGSYEPMRVLFLDVDQADATLVQLPGGRSLLVDAGGTVRGSFPVGERIVAPVLWHGAFAGWIISRSPMRIPTTWAGRWHYSKTSGPARSGRVCRCHGPRVSVSFRRSPAKAGRHGAGCKRGTSSVSVTSRSTCGIRHRRTGSASGCATTIRWYSS